MSRAHARFIRARAWMQTGVKDRMARAEKELRETGEGQTEFASDALYFLAENKENARQFPAALELYAQIQARFNGTTQQRLRQRALPRRGHQAPAALPEHPVHRAAWREALGAGVLPQPHLRHLHPAPRRSVPAEAGGGG